MKVERFASCALKRFIIFYFFENTLSVSSYSLYRRFES